MYLGAGGYASAGVDATKGTTRHNDDSSLPIVWAIKYSACFALTNRIACCKSGRKSLSPFPHQYCVSGWLA